MLIVLAAAVVLAFTTHYLLTGMLFRGSSLFWLNSALTVPGSIYASTPYATAVTASLAGLAMLTALVGFHYGAMRSLFAAIIVGVISGIHLGYFVLPLAASLAALPRVKRIPIFAWPVLSAAFVGGYCVWLAATNGPSSAPLYREALLDFTVGVGLMGAAATLAGALISWRMKYRSIHLPFVAVVVAAFPFMTIMTGSPPSEIEANTLLTLYAPERTIEGSLGEGFTGGFVTDEAENIAPENQLSHVFDVLRFVDVRRATAVDACDYYLGRFGSSASAPGVLVLKAKMLSAHVDLVTLKRFNRIECYFDRVSSDAEAVYGDIIEKFGESPEAAPARFYLAEAAFQKGKPSEALKLYTKAADELARVLPASFAPSKIKPAETVRELFDEADRRAARFFNEAHSLLLTARRRQSLIEKNSDFGGQPLARLGALDRKSEDFAERIAMLAADYPESLLIDNIDLILAEHLKDPIERAGQIESLLVKHPGSDVRDRMLLSLARAYLAGNLSGSGQKKAELVLRRLIADHTQSTWLADARALLAGIETASR
jgi:hypothetical protein